MNDPFASIEQLTMSGVKELQALAESGNTIAREWLMKIEAVSDVHTKLSFFGEMRIALLSDAQPEAKAVMGKVFPNEDVSREEMKKRYPPGYFPGDLPV